MTDITYELGPGVDEAPGEQDQFTEEREEQVVVELDGALLPDWGDKEEEDTYPVFGVEGVPADDPDLDSDLTGRADGGKQSGRLCEAGLVVAVEDDEVVFSGHSKQQQDASVSYTVPREDVTFEVSNAADDQEVPDLDVLEE